MNGNKPFAAPVNLALAAGRLARAMVDSRPLTVDQETFEKRMEICTGCRDYDALKGRCTVCRCVLAGRVLAKARLATEKCPKEKW